MTIEHTVQISSNNLSIIDGEYVQVCITINDVDLHRALNDGEQTIADLNEEIKDNIVNHLIDKIKNSHILFHKMSDPIENVTRFYGRICLVPKSGLQRIKEHLK